MARRRILKEYKDFTSDPPRACGGGPSSEDDPFHWTVMIFCDNKDSPHYDGLFLVKVEFPSDYPFKPPRLRMATQIFHPQLWQTENYSTFCTDLLGAGWSPALTISKVLQSVTDMLHEPFSAYQQCRCCTSMIDEAEAKANRARENPTGATALYFSDRKSYNQKAREWTFRYATGADIGVEPESTSQPQVDAQPQPQRVRPQQVEVEPVADSNQANDDEKKKEEQNKAIATQKEEEKEEDVCIRLLREWKLSQYAASLIDEKGYDDVDDWIDITEQQLMQDMNFKEGHAKRFVRKMKTYAETLQKRTATEPEVSIKADTQWKEQLATLNAMGFPDEAYNLALLKQHSGDVIKVTEALFEFYGQ